MTDFSASDDQHQDSDRQTMRRLVEILPWDGAIEFIRQQHFGEPFDRRCFRDLWAFKTECSNPAFEFLDADLDGLRAALLTTIIQFQNVHAPETFTLDSDLDWSQVPSELKWREPQRYRKIIDDIHAAASAVCNSYDQLIRSGRRKLGVPDAG
jgi:hypothetical protein